MNKTLALVAAGLVLAAFALSAMAVTVSDVDRKLMSILVGCWAHFF